MSDSHHAHKTTMALREKTGCNDICHTGNGRSWGWPKKERILGIWQPKNGRYTLIKGISFTDALELEKNGKLLEWFETEIAISKMKE